MYHDRLVVGLSPPGGIHEVGDGDGRGRGEDSPAGVGGFHPGGHIPPGPVEGGRGSPGPLCGDVDDLHAGSADGLAAAVHGGEPYGGGGQAGRPAGRVPDDHDAAAAVVSGPRREEESFE